MNMNEVTQMKKIILDFYLIVAVQILFKGFRIRGNSTFNLN